MNNQIFFAGLTLVASLATALVYGLGGVLAVNGDVYVTDTLRDGRGGLARVAYLRDSIERVTGQPVLFMLAGDVLSRLTPLMLDEAAVLREFVEQALRSRPAANLLVLIDPVIVQNPLSQYVVAGSTVCSLLVLPFVPLPEPAAWPFIAATV